MRPAVRLGPPLSAIALVLVLGAGACRDDALDAVPAALPESIPEDALPALPSLAGEQAIGPVSAPEAPLTLAFAAGRSWRDRVAIRQTVRQHGPGLPRGESEIRQRLTIDWTVVDWTVEDADGGSRLRAAVGDVTVELKPDLPTVAANAAQTLGALAWTCRRDARGRYHDLRVVGTPPDDVEAGFRLLSGTLTETRVILPEGPVGAGESWSYAAELTIPLAEGASVPAKLDATATLRGVTEREGRATAVLDVTLRETLGGPIRTAGLDGAVVGAAHGRGVVLFDVAAGAVVGADFALGGRHEVLVEDDGRRRLLVQEHTARIEVTGSAPQNDATRAAPR